MCAVHTMLDADLCFVLHMCILVFSCCVCFITSGSIIDLGKQALTCLHKKKHKGGQQGTLPVVTSID